MADPGLARKGEGQGRAPPKFFSGEGAIPRIFFDFESKIVEFYSFWAPFLQFSYLLYKPKTLLLAANGGMAPVPSPWIRHCSTCVTVYVYTYIFLRTSPILLGSGGRGFEKFESLKFDLNFPAPVVLESLWLRKEATHMKSSFSWMPTIDLYLSQICCSLVHSFLRTGTYNIAFCAHGRPQAWASAMPGSAMPLGQVPLEMLKSVLCISIYSKTLSRPIIYALFSQFLSASGALSPDPHQGSTPGPRWGSFVSRPPNLPTPGKILRAPMSAPKTDQKIC